MLPPILAFLMIIVGLNTGFHIGRYYGARKAWEEQRAWFKELRQQGKLNDIE